MYAFRCPLYAFTMPLPLRIEQVIARLNLAPHPEGGYFRETHRSGVALVPEALPPGYPGPRAASTCILFLLPTGVRSRWHRVRSEEIWLHHQGDPLELRIAEHRPASDNAPVDRVVTLGQSPDESLQAVVPAGHWQDAHALPGEAGYALVACVVAPGFDFEDFEIVD